MDNPISASATFNSIKDAMRFIGKHTHEVIVINEAARINYENNKHRREMSSAFKKHNPQWDIDFGGNKTK